jgi:hypothetical protein
LSRKRKTDDSSLSRRDHFIATQKIGIDAARAESEQCYKDTTAHGVGREERAKLLKTAMELGTLCDSLEKQNTPRSSSFGQTDSGFGKVVLSRVPAELKGLMDYKPTLPVTEFFPKLGDSLQSENSSSKVPWLISCLTGKLLQRFREQIELCVWAQLNLRVTANRLLGFWYLVTTRTCKTWVQWSDRLDQGNFTRVSGYHARAWAIRTAVTGITSTYLYALYAFFFFKYLILTGIY